MQELDNLFSTLSYRHKHKPHPPHTNTCTLYSDFLGDCYAVRETIPDPQ